MFNKVYLGATPISKIYLGTVPIKYNSGSIDIPDNAVAVYTVAASDPLQLSPSIVTGKADDWTETGTKNEDGSYTIIITASEAPSKISFSGNTALLSVEYIDTTNLTTVYDMFYGCYSLKTVNMPDCISGKITSLSRMFYNCYDLISVDMRNWGIELSASDKAANMFYNCPLRELRLDNCKSSMVYYIVNADGFPVFSVEDEYLHTIYCRYELIMYNSPPSWSYSFVNYPLITYQFMNDDGEGDSGDFLPSFGGDFIQYTDWYYEDEVGTYSTTRTIRRKGKRPTSIYLSNWSLEKVTYIDLEGVTILQFGNHYALSSVSSYTLDAYGLHNNTWDTSRVTNMSLLFWDCRSLHSVLAPIDCSNATYGLYGTASSSAFYNCQSLETLYLKNIYANVSMNKGGSGILGTLAAGQNQKYSIDLSTTIVKDECLLDIINELPDLINDKRLTDSARSKIVLYLPPTNTLTATQVQVAIDKGWTVQNTTY